MAVPKKKKSKGKRNQRHSVWKAKAGDAAKKALSLGKSILSGRAQGFVYPVQEEDDDEQGLFSSFVVSIINGGYEPSLKASNTIA